MIAVRSLVLCFLFSHTLTLCAQELFHKSYGYSQLDEPGSAVAMPDGGLVICGTHLELTPTYKRTIFLMRIDSSGNQIWNREYSADQQAIASKVFLAGDGGFYIVGTTAFGFSGYFMTVMKTDSTGNLQWARQSAALGVNDVKRVKGGFISTGQVSFANQSNIAVVKTDTMGVTQWAKVYFRDDAGIGFAIEPTYDGGYLVTGRSNSFGFSASAGMFLMKLDSIGNVEWNRMISNSNPASPAGQGHCIFRDDRDSTYNIACGLPFVTLMVLRKNFSLQQSSMLTLNVSSGNGVFHDIKASSDGGYSIAMECNGKTLFMALDSTRQAGWYKLFETSSPSPYPYMTTFESGNGIRWLLSSDAVTNGNVSVCRFNASTTICDTANPIGVFPLTITGFDSLFAQYVYQGIDSSVVMVQQNLGFSTLTPCTYQADGIEEDAAEHSSLVFPNPVSCDQQLHIENSSDASCLIIYDAAGRCVLSASLIPGLNIIMLPVLTPGLYTYAFDESQNASGKLIVR